MESRYGVGYPLPAIELPTLDGDPISLADLRETPPPVYVGFLVRMP